MIIFDIVLWDFTLISLFLLGQEVDREGLLQQSIALVLLVRMVSKRVLLAKYGIIR